MINEFTVGILIGTVIGGILMYWGYSKLHPNLTVEDCLAFLKDKGYWVRIGPK